MKRIIRLYSNLIIAVVLTGLTIGISLIEPVLFYPVLCGLVLGGIVITVTLFKRCARNPSRQKRVSRIVSLPRMPISLN